MPVHSRMTADDLASIEAFQPLADLPLEPDTVVDNDLNLDQLAKERQKEEEKMPRPIPMPLSTVQEQSWRDKSLFVGKRCQSKAELELLVAGDNEGQGKLVKVRASSPRKLTFGCACDEGCNYIMRSSLEWNGDKKAFTEWTVKDMAPHTCAAVVVQKGQKHSNYSPEQLVPAFVGSIANKNSASVPFLTGIVKQYTFRAPDPMFVSRLRDMCILEKWGKEEVLTDELEAFLEGMEEHGHKVTIKTATKKEFEVIGMHNKKVEHRNLMAGKKKNERTQFDEEAARMEVQASLSKYQDDDAIIVHLGFAPNNLVNDPRLHENYLTVFACDASHIKTKEGGNVFDCVLKDANGQVQTAFLMVSAMNESEESWRYFMTDMRNIYGEKLDRKGTVFIMDGDKGGRAAVKSVWSNAVLQFMCTRHLGAVIAKISAADAALYQKAAIQARSRQEVEELVKRMTEKTRQKLTKDLRLEEWSLICSGINYGNHTSNMSEGIHSTMLGARRMNMIACFKEIVNGEAARFIKHHQLASQCINGRFPPSVQKQLDNMLPSIATRYDPHLQSPSTQATVTSFTDGRQTWRTDMDKQTCSCPFQSTRLEVWEPHVLAHAVKANFALDRAINPKWSGATYREQYLNRTFKVPTTDEVESKKLTLLSTAGVKLSFRLPPKYAPRRGRPTSKEQERKKSAIEKAGGMQTRGKKERGVLAKVPRNSRLLAEVAEKAEEEGAIVGPTSVVMQKGMVKIDPVVIDLTAVEGVVQAVSKKRFPQILSQAELGGFWTSKKSSPSAYISNLLPGLEKGAKKAMEEALSKNKPEHVGQPGPLPAWIDVLTPDDFAMIENRESMANDKISLFFLSVLNYMYRESTCSPKGQPVPEGKGKIRLFGPYTHPAIMSCPVTSRKKDVAARHDKFLRYMEPKHAEVSPLEELDGIVVVLHVFEIHYSVLRINISGKCLTYHCSLGMHDSTTDKILEDWERLLRSTAKHREYLKDWDIEWKKEYMGPPFIPKQNDGVNCFWHSLALVHNFAAGNKVESGAIQRSLQSSDMPGIRQVCLAAAKSAIGVRDDIRKKEGKLVIDRDTGEEGKQGQRSTSEERKGRKKTEAKGVEKESGKGEGGRRVEEGGGGSKRKSRSGNGQKRKEVEGGEKESGKGEKGETVQVTPGGGKRKAGGLVGKGKGDGRDRRKIEGKEKQAPGHDCDDDDDEPLIQTIRQRASESGGRSEKRQRT